VLDELVPNGLAHRYEANLWDYKRELPRIPASQNLTKVEALNHDLAVSRIVKDVVSFYNTYGGYLVIGIADDQRTVVGHSDPFDCNDFNKRTFAATKHSIECRYAVHPMNHTTPPVEVGILHIPKRPDALGPAQFVKDAPASPTGKREYKRHDIYFRDTDQCRPAVSSEELAFLCARRIPAPIDQADIRQSLSNNLGPRDAGLVKFVGRQDLLHILWSWLSDAFSSPCKLLAGLGGVGKTTVARELCEVIVRDPPAPFHCLVWLTAKQRQYEAVTGRYHSTPHVDFTDARTMLLALLKSLSCPDSQLDSDATLTDLVDQAVQELATFPAFIVVDDLDSLEQNEQAEAYHAMVAILNRTAHSALGSSRCLVTSRLTLGAPPSILVPVQGLSVDDFYDYAAVTAENAGVPWPYKKGSKLVIRFRKATDGSPVFAASMIRLLKLGHSLETVLERWKGADGEEVRRFAFEREIETLTGSQTRTLFASSILTEASFDDLLHVTESSNTLLEDDIGRLQQFHMLALGSEIKKGGIHLRVPVSICIMRDILAARIADPRKIEKRCKDLSKEGPKVARPDVGAAVRRVASLWRNGENEEALEAAQLVSKQFVGDSDVLCLVGTAYLKVASPRAKEADVCFRNAYEAGCRRSELWENWIRSKVLQQDYVGVLDVCERADDDRPCAENAYWRTDAYYHLGERAEQKADVATALEHYKSGWEAAVRAVRRFSRGPDPRLRQLAQYSLRAQLACEEAMCKNANDDINVWLTVRRASTSWLFGPDLLWLGARKLRSWWFAVEERRPRDSKALQALDVGLDELEGMQRKAEGMMGYEQAARDAVRESCAELRARGSVYRKKLLLGKS
jgi:tetratricopeptide (TPR) repeat protein